MKDRQKFNRQLVERLTTYVEKYPDMRLGQILETFGFVHNNISPHSWRDEFYLESEVLLERVNKKAKDLFE